MNLKSLLPSSMRDGDTRAPLLLKHRSSKWYIITTVSIAIFTDIFLYGIIVPVMPFALTKRAHIQPRDVQHWVSILLAVYAAGLLFASPILGWLVDKSRTRRMPLLIGLVVLSGATIMLCIGTSIGILVAGRLLQGLSAAVVWTTGLALLVDTVGQKEVGQTMGIISLAYSISILCGPMLGGIVYAKSGYYAVFYMAFGLIAVDVFLRLTFIEKKVAARWLPAIEVPLSEDRKRVDERVGIQMSPQAQDGIGRDEQPSYSAHAERLDSRKARKLPPVVFLLKSRRILTAFWGIMVVASLMTAFDSTLPLYVNKIFGWNSFGSGLLFLALLLPSATGPVIGRLSDKYGPRWLAAVGLITGLPFWVLLRLVTHKSMGQIVLLCSLLFLIGICVALVMPPLMAEFTYIVDAKERQNPGLFGATGAYAQAYGLFNAAWAAGSFVGPIWAGFVQAKAGWSTMTWTLGVLSAVTTAPVLVYTGGLIYRKNPSV